MIPSSKLWSMHHPTNILVYPMSCYEIMAAKKTLANRRKSERARWTATGRRYHTVGVGGHGHGSHAAASDGHRHQHIHRRRRRRLRPRRCRQQPKDEEGDEESSSTNTSTSLRQRSSPSSSRGCSPSDDRQRHSRWRRHQRSHPRNLHGKITMHLSRRDNQPGTVGDVVGSRYRSGRQKSPDDCHGDTCTAVRCSANLVLLAHSNRSLHVLVIQRSQTRYFHVNHVTTATTMIRYKLPGGQFSMTDEEQEKYLQEDRNVCGCPDDERWYTGAINHFLMAKSLPKVLSSTRSPNSFTSTTTSSNSPPPYEHYGTYTTDESATEDPSTARRLFVPLGKWYRTQDKEARERDGCCNATAVRNAIASGGDSHAPHCWYYYPYKPAHVSRQAVEEKRLYGVPDVSCLFGGGQPSTAFRVPTPRAKVKTIVCPDGSIVHKTTTYKCKFVPLARLHENNRLYGPILSSLPVVVSSMNLICLQ